MQFMNEAVLRVMARVQSRERDEEGQGLAEYGLILALIAVVCIAALTALGAGVRTKLEAVTAGLNA
jgi:pilus assembly protein Flp/PilA